MTGEMSQQDIEKNGEFYEVRKDLEYIAKKSNKKCQVKPFDKYQGPFAEIFGYGQLWKLDDYQYYFDSVKYEFIGAKKEMIAHLKNIGVVELQTC